MASLNPKFMQPTIQTLQNSPLDILQTTSKPTCVENALVSPMWKKTMDVEFGTSV